eukprot:CAMPEP_0119545694 /NCGR_PEP_ID=MMETSP1352-20130426/370_1 /TAXON_ID=265584 /ORGANISM="Stauroneis constricta, Strain CCMP1120" /LENGTH=790 /DNA_ID=CAMNT_0007590275 /DNA_START=295 /DNA_END=2667 /DNA_ORIENTATION=+
MGFTTVESALNGKRRSDSGGSAGSSSTAAMGNRSEYGATTTTTMSVTSVTSSVYNGMGNGFVSPLATPKTPSSTATPSTSPSTFASMTPVSSRSSSASKKHRPLPLKQRTSSIDTRRDVTSNTISSLLVLLKPREYFITVDHFSIWRRHLAWAMENGKDLRSYMTQRYASNMVFMSLLLSTELGVLFNSAQLNTNVRMQLQLGNHMSVEFWAGFMILVSALLTILGLFSTFTAWAMVNAVDEHNAHCIFRSSIGQYAAELPGRFILFSTYSFLLSFWLFLFLLLPFGVWSLSLLVIGVSLFIHVVAAFSAFGRIIMHTGAMGKTRIFEHGFEQSLLPHTLHTNLFNKAKANLAHNTSITRQYRKKQAPIDRIYHSQDELYYHLGHTSSSSSSNNNRGNGNPLRNQRDSFSSSRSSISSTNSTGSNTVVAGNESQHHNHQHSQYPNHNQNHNHHYHNGSNNNNSGDSDVETPYRRRSDSLVRFADEEKNGMGLVQDMIKSSSNHVSSPPATRLPKSALSRKSSYGNTNKNKNNKQENDDKMHPTPKTVNIRRPSPPPPPLLTVPPPPPPPPQQPMPPPLHASSLPPPPQIITRSRSLTTSVHTTAEQEEVTPRSAQSAPQPPPPPPKPPLPAPMRSSVAQVSTSSLEQWLVGGSTATTDATTASSSNASRKGSPLPFQEVHTKSAPMLLPHKASDLSMDDDDDDHDENQDDNRNTHHHQYNPPKPQQRNHHTRNPSLISINVDTRDLSEEERFLMDYGDFESPMVPSSSTGVSPASYYNLPSKFTYEEEEE